ncbi:MAG: hypothetical protein ACI3U2_02035 [Anaerovibrio sp.]
MGKIINSYQLCQPGAGGVLKPLIYGNPDEDTQFTMFVTIAERLPEKTIQEEQNLLMYYDISLGRV